MLAKTGEKQENLSQGFLYAIWRKLTGKHIQPNNNDHPDETPITSDMVTRLSSEDWVIRRDATMQIGRFPYAIIAPYLDKALHDEDMSVRLAAVHVLATHKDPQNIELLSHALYDSESTIVDEAAKILKSYGENAVDSILEALESPQINARGAAAEILYDLALPETTPQLVTALADTSTPWMQEERVCDIAARALEKIGTPKSLQAVAWWRQLQEQQEQERNELSQHGELFVPDQIQEAPAENEEQSDIDKLKGLLGQIEAETWGSSEEAAKELRTFAISRQKQENEPLVAYLLEQLNHESWIIRYNIIEALTHIKEDAVAIQLIPLIKDHHWMIRMAAIRAIAEYQPTEALKPLCIALGDTNPNVREAAAETIGQMKNPEAMTSLRWIINDGDPYVRIATVQAMSKMDSPDAIPLLLTAACDKDVNVRWEAVKALENLADKTCIAILELSLEDASHPIWEKERICDLAVKALEHINTPDALNAIRRWENNQQHSS